METRTVLIECDMPGCTITFRAKFVTPNEMARYLNAAKREGWRQVRAGDQMLEVCPGHLEVI